MLITVRPILTDKDTYPGDSDRQRDTQQQRQHRKHRRKHGGGRQRLNLDGLDVAAAEPSDDLLALDEALGELAAADPQAARLVELRYFAGLTIRQAAEALGVAPRTADFLWAYARAWLLQKLQREKL